MRKLETAALVIAWALVITPAALATALVLRSF
jgi:hypothetical protein